MRKTPLYGALVLMFTGAFIQVASIAGAAENDKAANAVQSENIFAPYLKDESPKIVETVSKEIVDGVEITKFKFINRVIPGTNEKVIIYAIMGRPLSEGKHPAIIACHGGGGRANPAQAWGWAKQGYVSICVDEPGVTDPDKTDSTGPWKKFGWSAFGVKDGDATHNMLFDGVTANLNALALLRSRPDVDQNRIGIMGVSWGGYMTTIISGIAGDRIKASFCIYGCGYYDIGSFCMALLENMKNYNPKGRELWLKNLDAGRWASHIKSDFFGLYAANDWYFWPSAAMATYKAINSPKNLAISPNSHHAIRFPGYKPAKGPKGKNAHLTSMEIQWMDYYLKGEGKLFPKCLPTEKPVKEGSGVKVFFKAEAPEKLTKSSVWYSYGKRPWRCRYWREVKAKEESDGLYSAVIPVKEPSFTIDWFGLVSDIRDITVSTTVQTFKPAALGFKSEDRKVELFKEDFESDIVDEKWKHPVANHFKNANHRIYKDAAHTGEKGLSIKGKKILACGNIHGGILKSSEAKGISLWARSKGGTGFEVMLMSEAKMPHRYYWCAEVESPGDKWKKIDLTWDKFKYAGFGGGSTKFHKEKADKKKLPPMDMISTQLGQFRIVTPEKAEIDIDDIETIK